MSLDNLFEIFNLLAFFMITDDKKNGITLYRSVACSCVVAVAYLVAYWSR